MKIVSTRMTQLLPHSRTQHTSSKIICSTDMKVTMISFFCLVAVLVTVNCQHYQDINEGRYKEDPNNDGRYYHDLHNIHVDPHGRNFYFKLGSYKHDNDGKYSHDGTYAHDHSGAYQHDRSGEYSHDHSGIYNHDHSGSYSHDHSGAYSHDPSGNYQHDASGHYVEYISPSGLSYDEAKLKQWCVAYRDSGLYHYKYAAPQDILAEECAKIFNEQDGEFLRVKGYYKFLTDDGEKHVVDYTADENGYIPNGNHLHPALLAALKYHKTQGRVSGSSQITGAGKKFEVFKGYQPYYYAKDPRYNPKA